jgi:hypothetical protein
VSLLTEDGGERDEEEEERPGATEEKVRIFLSPSSSPARTRRPEFLD